MPLSCRDSSRSYAYTALPDSDNDGIFNDDDIDVDGDGIINMYDRDIDNDGLLRELTQHWRIGTTDLTRVSYDLKYLGYTNMIIDSPYYGVESIETNQYGTTYITLYHIFISYISIYHQSTK